MPEIKMEAMPLRTGVETVANPLYNMLMGHQMPIPQQNIPQGSPMMSPMQRAQGIAQAMQNPAAFVKQYFPDIPPEIQNNPNQILQYIQKTRGISNKQINLLVSQMPRF